MLVHNFDYLPLIQPFYALRDRRPADGLRSLDFTVAPLAGAVGGMNEAGLCTALNYAFVVDTPTPAPTITMAVAAALARCTTVQEAARAIAEGPRWGGGLVMLADAAGDIASLELSNTRAELVRPEPGRGVLYHTNRFRTKAMRAVELPPSATYTRRAPRPLRGRRVHRSSEERSARFDTLLAGNGSISEAALASVMADHGVADAASADTICMHSDYWFTTATLCFLPRSRRVRVAFQPACQAELVDVILR
jgi:hypothetical protein